MKKILITILTVVMILVSAFNYSFSSVATELEDAVTYEYFQSVISQKFDDEGINFEVVYDSNYVYTQCELDDLIEYIESIDFSFEVTSIEGDIDTTQSTTRLMPFSYSYCEIYTVYAGIVGYANFAIVNQGTVDLQGSSVIAVSRNTVALDAAFNYSSDSLTSTYTYGSGPYVYINISGYVMFVMSVDGIAINVNKEVNYNTSFNAESYT